MDGWMHMGIFPFGAVGNYGKLLFGILRDMEKLLLVRNNLESWGTEGNVYFELLGAKQAFILYINWGNFLFGTILILGNFYLEPAGQRKFLFGSIISWGNFYLETDAMKETFMWNHYDLKGSLFETICAKGSFYLVPLSDEGNFWGKVVVETIMDRGHFWVNTIVSWAKLLFGILMIWGKLYL